MELWIRVGKGQAGHYIERKIEVEKHHVEKVLRDLTTAINNLVKDLERYGYAKGIPPR